MNLTDIANYRYSTKEFNSNKKIPEPEFQQILDLLRFSPSSVNSQPWHFLIATSKEAKERVSKGTQGVFKFNEAKILDASHVIVFCAKTEIDEQYMLHLLASEERDGRFAEPAHKDMMHAARAMFINIHRYDLKDVQHWIEKQVYLNMGTILLGAGALGIDGLPMEGVDKPVLDQEFGLREQGYSVVGVLSLGYRADTDFNAALPKSRLPSEEIFTFLP
ncbi:oxygen-insensitive NAD(P)H nitroreductase [Thalassotalea aquiviva]|uniref:oxygen-insensitive NAD(P)H nitroreductase n=1 Tax=Thalassotalea aquiviva TaxID=3242415 RepID=UPI00352A943E